MDEMREAMMRLAYNIRNAAEGLMMEEKTVFTLGDVLDLLGRDDTKVDVYLADDMLRGKAGSALWADLEERCVAGISPSEWGPGLDIRLEGEDHDNET